MTKYARKFEIASSHFVSKHKHLANPLYPLVCLRNLWTPPRLDTFLKIIALKFIKNNQATVQFPESTKLYTYQIVYVFWDIFVIAQPNFEKKYDIYVIQLKFGAYLNLWNLIPFYLNPMGLKYMWLNFRFHI